MSAALLATASPPARTTPAPARSSLRHKLLVDGWSPDDIQLVQGALTAVALHDNYLRAGYSPDEIEQLTSLY
jgi:hypothetical protein